MLSPALQTEAVNLRKELLEAFRAGKFLEAVFNCSLGNGDRRDQTASEVVTLHNEGLIDIVSAFEALKKDPTSHPDFFLTRHIFEKALPEISAPTSSVLRCVVHLFREAGQDLAAGTVVDSYDKFCKRSVIRCYETIKEIEKDPSTFSLLLPTTIGAGMTFAPDDFVDEAIRLCNSEDVELKKRHWPRLQTVDGPKGPASPNECS